MKIEVLGTESLGVRGLSCVVETEGRTIVIDPGVALGYLRRGKLPHPHQVAAGAEVREKIVGALKRATDVVISHYHGDHIPLAEANPYQLSLSRVPSLDGVRLWCKGPHDLSDLAVRRWIDLSRFAGCILPDAEERSDGTISFSQPVPHGSRGSRLGTVMMTRIQDGDEVFVHASDIQLLDGESISIILDWRPTIVLASGPPLYLSRLRPELREVAWENGMALTDRVDTLILDHHLLRSVGGYRWMERLSETTCNRVTCAARFMGKEPRLLEAKRDLLYAEMPVPPGWHEAYAEGRMSFDGYRDLSPGCQQSMMVDHRP
ncbi:MAG TPA: MBL fold metallo-hydrolase [Methanothrix sp.]|nr:MBL fold metallo-hydrolase [Methanothrix sp.]